MIGGICRRGRHNLGVNGLIGGICRRGRHNLGVNGLVRRSLPPGGHEYADQRMEQAFLAARWAMLGSNPAPNPA